VGAVRGALPVEAADVISGKPFLAMLPQVDGYHAAWPKEPFRRGFGWSLFVPSIARWSEFTERCLTASPSGR